MKTPDDYLDINTPIQQPQKRRSREREREGGRGREGGRERGERERGGGACARVYMPRPRCVIVSIYGSKHACM